jgi:hypothetical protein
LFEDFIYGVFWDGLFRGSDDRMERKGKTEDRREDEGGGTRIASKSGIVHEEPWYNRFGATVPCSE